SSCEIIPDGMTIEASAPPSVIGLPGALLMMTTATAPAACAFATFWVRGHAPRQATAMLPAGKPTSGPHPSCCSADPSATRTNGAEMPATGQGGPQSAPLRTTVSVTAPPTSSSLANGEFQTNICMRGGLPSAEGVEKLALFVPLKSCASARTGSPPVPRPETTLVTWKLPLASSNP